LGFAVFLVFRAVSFSLDFFFVVFGLGVGVWRRFDFDEPLGSGVSRGVADGVVPSGSPDSLADVVLRLFGDSCGPGDPLLFSLAPFFAVFLLKLGAGDFFGVGEASSSVRAFSDANLARGIAVDASSGVAEACCLFADLLFAPFAFGVGDFLGREDEALASLDSDSSRRLFCSSPTCARRTPVMIAPTASAVATQMRKRTTATERNRARDAINGIVKKVNRDTEVTKVDHFSPFNRCNVVTLQLATAGSGARGAALRILSRSRRRMAFNLPPSNSSRQVRYIQVSSTTMDASARYVGL